MSQCKRCQKRGKDWNGDAPRCFNDFGADNWNCATLNAIRVICSEGHPPGVDYQYCDDQKYATVKISDCENIDGDRIGLALWVSWYKNRGQTEALWILSDTQPPRIPTEDDLNIIIDAYSLRN